MGLKAGTVADFENSLAAAMEDAMKKAWPIVKGRPLPEEGEEERRLLFVAIAQGVVAYLKENAADSLLVHDVAVTQESGNNISSSDTSGPTTVTVTQDSGSGNRVQSTGDGKVRVETTGELY